MVVINVARTIDWAQNVATKYMQAHFETTRCNKYLSLNSVNQMAKLNNLKQTSVECSYDKMACDNSEILWNKYEESVKNYHKRWKWMPY